MPFKGGGAGRFILINVIEITIWRETYNGYPNFLRHFGTPKSFMCLNLALTDFENSKTIFLLFI